MWSQKTYVALVHQKCAKALGGEETIFEEMSSSQKTEVLETTYSLLCLHLSENVFIQVDDKSTVTKIWLKLEFLYLTKSLTNKIYLKEQLFGFKIESTKSLDDNLDKLNKITVSLTNIDEKISDENQTIIILNSSPDSFKDVKDVIKYDN